MSTRPGYLYASSDIKTMSSSSVRRSYAPAPRIDKSSIMDSINSKGHQFRFREDSPRQCGRSVVIATAFPQYLSDDLPPIFRHPFLFFPKHFFTRCQHNIDQHSRRVLSLPTALRLPRTLPPRQPKVLLIDPKHTACLPQVTVAIKITVRLTHVHCVATTLSLPREHDPQVLTGLTS